MRVTICPRGHKLEIDENDYPVVIAEEDELGPITLDHVINSNCTYCWDLYRQRKPFKAKRTGES